VELSSGPAAQSRHHRRTVLTTDEVTGHLYQEARTRHSVICGALEKHLLTYLFTYLLAYLLTVQPVPALATHHQRRCESDPMKFSIA